jgi:hypothetical protein
MGTEKQKVNALQIACFVFGFVVITTIARFGFGFEGIIVNAIAGALGALLGYLIFEVIKKLRDRNG